MKTIIRAGYVLMIVVLLLQGCMNVAVTGAEAVYNRHSLQKQWSDQVITMKAYKALNREIDRFRHTNITVATYQNEVLLVGQVPEAPQKQSAEELIQSIPGVKHVYNFLTVSGVSSALTGLSDCWITSKVKTRLMVSNDVDATQVKVITENGIVYLRGILQPEEADAAVDITRSTDGVVGVVKIFSYVKIYKNTA